MTTSRHHSRVSLAAALALAVTVASCASVPVGAPGDAVVEQAGTVRATAARTIRFDNQGHEFVRVYLVINQREFMLGRVERGTRATLRLPDGIGEANGWMRLAVRTGAEAAETPRLTTMGAEPFAELLAQRWTFSQTLAGGEITGMPIKPR